MNITLKLLLWTHKIKSNGTHPIYLKVTIAGKTSYMATGDYILPRQWDPKNEQVKNHELASHINARIRKMKSDVSARFTADSLAGRPVTAASLKDNFRGGKTMTNLFDFAESFSEEVRHKRGAATIENYRKAMKKIEDYNGSRQLSFQEITPEWLQRYETFLRTTGFEREIDDRHGAGLSNNYIHALFKILKTMFNAAIKRGIITEYPFSKYENPVYSAPQKDYLDLPEIHLIEKFADETTNPVLRQAAVYFLLGISTGLRISDWPKFSLQKNVKDGRVLLRATKNGEWVSMPVNALLKRNLKRLAACSLTIEEPTINEKLKEIARTVGIDKHLTSHTGRHTFAITLCADRGISCETCAELMGITINTCVQNYYKVSSRKIDKETAAAWKGL